MSTGASYAQVLVIGYGSELRGDDAAGRRVADGLEQAGETNVRVKSVHQLTPELAAEIAKSDAVVFVDACAVQMAPKVRVRHLVPSETQEPGTHTGKPEQLLGMAKWLYGRAPNAWAIDVPAAQFDFGHQLSQVTEQGICDALQIIKDIISDENRGANLHA